MEEANTKHFNKNDDDGVEGEGERTNEHVDIAFFSSTFHVYSNIVSFQIMHEKLNLHQFERL